MKTTIFFVYIIIKLAVEENIATTDLVFTKTNYTKTFVSKQSYAETFHIKLHWC